jgi:cob(I)alamin adenosyltransferase
MRIYTRTGDDGTTGLYGGARVSKAAERVEVYGTVDELNAVLGWARAAKLPPEIDRVLERAQEGCFRLGAFLAVAPGKDPGILRLGDGDILAFEQAIDALEAGLQPLKTFVLPGGVEGAARLHLARTVCRRAERALVGLSARETVDPLHVRWLNRLSDLLFVQARAANRAAGVPDVPWHPPK